MFCSKCGTANMDQAAFCAQCGEAIGAAAGYGSPPPHVQPQQVIAQRDIGEDPGMRMLLPVGRSPLAIAAGYLGLFSVCGLPAPLAVIFGALAIMDIQKNPEKHGMGRAIFGLVMGILGSIGLVIAILGNL